MRRIFIFILFLIFGFTQISSNAYASDIYTTEKLITVDLTKQMLTAWENGHIVFQTKTSSGLPKTPTVKGSFRVFRKVSKQRMKGESKWYGKYDYKNVPNVMYFYDEYAIHGAYWHNRFGRPNSHGCVNVSVAASKWLYDWAPVGTRVEIY